MNGRKPAVSSQAPAVFGPERCPLCGQPNGCQLCTTAVYKGPCWCEAAGIPDELLARAPAELRGKACICRACVDNFRTTSASNSPQTVLPGDSYSDPGGILVFTAAYHWRRGYCCGGGCRHCPYPDSE